MSNPSPVQYTGAFIKPQDALMLFAPNRYRKLFKDLPTGDVEGASAAMMLIAQENCEGWAEAMARCVEMQKADWPELADRALGMEPHIDLFDVVLVLSGRKLAK